MFRYHVVQCIFGLCIVTSLVSTGYLLWDRFTVKAFSCQAHFVQYYPDDALVLWMTYHFDKKNGTLSISGHSTTYPEKRFNRKIAFSLQRKNSTYSLHSEENIVFPDETVDDAWLEKYEPGFFVYPDKNINVRIYKQVNYNYLFIFSNLPTYVCHNDLEE